MNIFIILILLIIINIYIEVLIEKENKEVPNIYDNWDKNKPKKPRRMNWKKREKEEYSFYVTGLTIVVFLIAVIYAIIQQLFFE